MLKGLQNLNEWLGQLTDLAKMLVVIGIIVGILFDDFFWSYRWIGTNNVSVWRCRICWDFVISDTSNVVRQKIIRN